MTQSLSWLILAMQIQKVNKFKHLMSSISCFETRTLVAKKNIFTGHFNLFLDHSLDAKGDCPSLKNYSLSKLLEIKRKLDLCHIWRVRNSKKMQYTSGQKHLILILKSAAV